jgi:hypothetical protein
MTINVNGEDRFYDDSLRKIFDKYYFRIIIWYFIFFVFCIINLVLYIFKIHDNYNLVVYLPSWYFPLNCLLLIILITKIDKPDFDYIECYYPEISKKIWIYGRNNGILNNFNRAKFYLGKYVEKGVDSIIDIIRNRKSVFPLFLLPFLILIIITIVSEIFRRH